MVGCNGHHKARIGKLAGRFKAQFLQFRLGTVAQGGPGNDARSSFEKLIGNQMAFRAVNQHIRKPKLIRDPNRRKNIVAAVHMEMGRQPALQYGNQAFTFKIKIDMVFIFLILLRLLLGFDIIPRFQ
ncbi:hypothetical protein SDC9_120780 [bioreactor metagenome]|uniref:Uncharacterized protein n=1 Tax=bioreactor metagenome TaxID=1076179 RepID=A0A645CA41_9ZZZZ